MTMTTSERSSGQAVRSNVLRNSAGCATAVQAPGSDPYHLLAIGGGIFPAHATGPEQLALSVALAHELAEMTGHGFMVESLMPRMWTIQSLMQALRDVDLTTVDALVVILGHRPTRATTAPSAARVADVVERLWRTLTPGSTITLAVCPSSITGRDSEGTDLFAGALSDRVNGLVRVERLSDSRHGESSSQIARRWGNTLAATVEGGLLDPLISAGSVAASELRCEFERAERLPGVLGRGAIHDIF